jgi:hypothetical protein
VERGGGAGAYALQFGGVKPDATASAVANVEGHVAGAFFAQWIFAGWTFHRLNWNEQDLTENKTEMKNYFRSQMARATGIKCLCLYKTKRPPFCQRRASGCS